LIPLETVQIYKNEKINKFVLVKKKNIKFILLINNFISSHLIENSYFEHGNIDQVEISMRMNKQ